MALRCTLLWAAFRRSKNESPSFLLCLCFWLRRFVGFPCLKGAIFKARKRNPNPNFWVQKSSVGVGLPREGVGGKKFGMSFETQKNQSFWQSISGFWPAYPGGGLKSLIRRSLCSILSLDLAHLLEINGDKTRVYQFDAVTCLGLS